MAPLNWRQPVPELTEVLASVGAAAVLFDAPNAEPALELASNLALRTISLETTAGADTSIAELLDRPVAAIRGNPDATAPWYLLFTSGTTGLPKAVIQTARMCWAKHPQCGAGHRPDVGRHQRQFPAAVPHRRYQPLHPAAVHSTAALRRCCRNSRWRTFSRWSATAPFHGFSRAGHLPGAQPAPAVDAVDWSRLRAACGGAPLPETQIRFFAERGLSICNASA